MNALEVEHLSVQFGDVPVIRDLSFAVRAGSSLAIIGPNGAGKTALFRALIGAIPSRGTIRWAPGTRIGYVPQKLDIERHLPVTGGDLLRARATLASAPAAAIAAALARTGLAEPDLRKPIGTLSGGQFQRLLVAFALLARPTVLLLDEATAGIDDPGQARLNDTLRRLQAEEGVTVLHISHDLSVVSRDATEVLCLSGTHPCFGPPREVLTPAMLEQLYGQPLGYHVHDDHDA